MKKFIVLALFLLAPFAQAQVLGELNGDGELKSEFKVVESGETSSYTRQCILAMNIHDSAQEFSFEYGYFQCGGLVFNHELPTLKKADGKLFYTKPGGELEQIGEVRPDGAIHVRIVGAVRTERYTEYIPDGITCDYSRGVVRQLTFHLYSYSDYEFRKGREGQWNLQLRWGVDSVANYQRKVGLCSYPSYSHATSVSEVTGQVK